MSDRVYEVPAQWAKRAYVDAAKYEEMYTRSLSDPQGFWGEHGKRIDWFRPFTRVKNTSFDPITFRSSGSRTASPMSRTIASTAICPSARTRPRSSGRATIREVEAHHLCRTGRPGGAFRQCA